MKTLLFVICFYQINSAHSNVKVIESNSSLIETLVDAVFVGFQEMFSKNIPVINLITCEGRQNTSKDFKTRLVIKYFLSLEVNVRIETSSGIADISGRRRRRNIFIVENLENIDELLQKIQLKYFRFNGFFLIVFLDKIDKIEEVLKFFLNLKILNINVIHQDANGEILVETFMPFRENRCMSSIPILINKFINGKFINDIFFPEKVKNLDSCPIRVSTSTNIEPYVVAKKLSDGSLSLGGVDIKVLMTLSDFLNFKINYTYFGKIGIFKDKETSTGTIKVLYDGNADVSISSWSIIADRLKSLDATVSYISESVILAIPTGRELTTIEKLLFPFSIKVWIAVVACFSIGLIAIFIINRQSKRFQNFVFGSSVQNPSLNLFIGFVGGSQKTLPGRNFARFILMVFLLYSLIIRTLYQGSFYNFMRSNRRHNEIESVNDMVKKDFNFFSLSYGIFLTLRGIDRMEKR